MYGNKETGKKYKVFSEQRSEDIDKEDLLYCIYSSLVDVCNELNEMKYCFQRKEWKNEAPRASEKS